MELLLLGMITGAGRARHCESNCAASDNERGDNNERRDKQRNNETATQGTKQREEQNNVRWCKQRETRETEADTSETKWKVLYTLRKINENIWKSQFVSLVQ